jgi:hypothetical protein
MVIAMRHTPQLPAERTASEGLLPTGLGSRLPTQLAHEPEGRLGRGCIDAAAEARGSRRHRRSIGHADELDATGEAVLVGNELPDLALGAVSGWNTDDHHRKLAKHQAAPQVIDTAAQPGAARAGRDELPVQQSRCGRAAEDDDGGSGKHASSSAKQRMCQRHASRVQDSARLEPLSRALPGKN